MKMLTVFTPTYNRAYCLHRVYNSLIEQTCTDFDWLIIDDGSTDDTAELVGTWIEENQISIRYHKQSNQGMHGAHNTAYQLIDNELNICIDSDDYMPSDAVEKIVSFWKSNGNQEVCGFAGLDSYTDGQIVGTRFPEGLKSSSLFDLYNQHNVLGDKKLVYRSELTKLYPYPLFEGEKYVGLAYKYYKLDSDYQLLLLNEVLVCVEYLPDGSSRNMLKQYRNNPKGFAFYRRELMKLPFASLSFKYRQAIHYVSSSLLSKNTRLMNESPEKALTLLALFPGCLLYLFVIAKT